MNARINPFGALLCASYDHHGLKLDLYGTLDGGGYEVQHVCIPGSLIAMTECVSAELLVLMSAKLDDTLPSAEQLCAMHKHEAKADRAEHDRQMAKDERMEHTWGFRPP